MANMLFLRGFGVGVRVFDFLSAPCLLLFAYVVVCFVSSLINDNSDLP